MKVDYEHNHTRRNCFAVFGGHFTLLPPRTRPAPCNHRRQEVALSSRPFNQKAMVRNEGFEACRRRRCI